MFSAVSRLSPVRTQMRMPAIANVAIVSGTPICSLSSMAVAPTNWRSFSISSAASISLSSRPVSACWAARWSSSHSRQSSSRSCRCASTRVRKPSFANPFSASLSSSTCTESSLSRSTITLSAPLINNMILPSGVRQTRDMRLRVLLNLLMLSTSYVSLLPKALMVCVFAVLAQKKKPRHFAASTSAPSSGDSAWYLILAGLVRSPSGTTV
mmetsp:Transcript_14793/g.21543  ORF Transcript_14793/g.21543 Transcript_14793/m.21543 type:complete len:211 (+) Transcript_14793:1785-2417(+)